MIKSNDELLIRLKRTTIEPQQQLCSLDVESLFTNVPVAQIDIILQSVYHHESIPSPDVPEETLKSFLKISNLIAVGIILLLSVNSQSTI